jgi:hypothetical protein
VPVSDVDRSKRGVLLGLAQTARLEALRLNVDSDLERSRTTCGRGACRRLSSGPSKPGSERLGQVSQPATGPPQKPAEAPGGASAVQKRAHGRFLGVAQAV